MKLLKVALDQGNYELAAHVLVYGLVKAKVEQNGKSMSSSKAKERRPQRQSERPEARLLQPGS